MPIDNEARLPVDQDVKLPANVQAQIDAANAHYQTQPDPAPEPAPAPAPDPAPEPAPAPAPDPTPSPQDGYPDKNAQLSQDQWRHQYLSMKGRYEQATMTIGGMQEQLTELGDEIARLHQVLRSNAQPPAPQQTPQQHLQNLTAEELDALSPEMLAVIQKVARATVMPELQHGQTAMRDIQQRLGRQAQSQIHQALFDAVPDWQAINKSQRFKQWCSLRDVYSGAVKGELLRRAFAAGDTARVIAFFKGFLNEEQATGQQDLELNAAAAAPQAPARQAAVSLEALAAPGRAKPAPGDIPTPADKPIFTRQQISTFYSDIRRGVYLGREAEKDATEQAIFAAQREGRVR